MTTAAAVTPFDYADSGWPIPDRIADAHRRSWQRLAAPGDWWSGPERVAIAAESRRARNLADGLSDDTPAPDAFAELPQAAAFAVAKIVADNTSLSPDWYRETITAPGMSDARYVEMLGVLVHVFSVDEFHRALSLPLEPLPTPAPGEPTRRRPPGAAQHGSWTPTLLPDDMEPADLDIYEEMNGRRPPNVLAAMSLSPDSVRWLNDLFAAHYLSWTEMGDYDNRLRALSRPQLELLASRISALNECFY